MHASLDGFVAGPKGEMNWIKLDDELWTHVNTITDRSDTALFGSVTYKMMESYWPTAAEKPDASKHDIDHAKWVNNAQKFVFSEEDMNITWENTKIIHDNVKEQMEKLKNEPGKDILMIGSPTLAHSFMELGLIDEYYLNLNPVVIGKGKSLFEVTNKIELELVSAKEFKSGVVGLHYRLK